ncbi:MAG: 30S ribosomal protein S17e [Promethearchaeota archaeon]
MGKVRTEVVKRLAREIINTYPEHFTTDFEDNKQKLFLVAEIKTKRLRNRIAGYITHLVKIEETRVSIAE